MRVCVCVCVEDASSLVRRQMERKGDEKEANVGVNGGSRAKGGHVCGVFELGVYVERLERGRQRLAGARRLYEAETKNTGFFFQRESVTGSFVFHTCDRRRLERVLNVCSDKLQIEKRSICLSFCYMHIHLMFRLS